MREFQSRFLAGVEAVRQEAWGQFRATGGDTKCLAIVLDTLREEGKFLGLYAPTKTDNTNRETRSPAEVQAELRKLLANAPRQLGTNGHAGELR